MDARAYFDLTDAISAAHSPAALEAIRTRIRATEMHPFERRVLERVLRTRAEALRDQAVLCGPPRRADGG